MNVPHSTCTRTEQAVSWALHALEPNEEIAVERHISTCADCSAAVRDTQAVTALLATAVEQVDPPARLRTSILDAVARTPQVRPQVVGPPLPPPRRPSTARPTGPAGPAPSDPRPTGPSPASRSRRLTPGRLVAAGMAVVAAVAIGALGWRNVQLQQELATASSQAASITALVQDMARPGTSHALLARPDGTTVAAVVVQGGRQTVYTIDLTANSADHIYVLWGLKDASSAAQPLGVFDVDARDAGPQTVGSPARQPFAVYAISLEPGRIPPAAPSDVVASGALAS
jgi:anti-sigma-K factor RskA